jgi:hypothetical protein
VVKFEMKRLLLIGLLLTTQVTAAVDPLVEARICGEPVRNADGTIRRRADVMYAFQKQHPCPATGLKTGACPNWAKDHVIPLACGGCDSVNNMQWLPNPIKSAAGIWPKDRWERKVNCIPQQLVP